MKSNYLISLRHFSALALFEILFSQGNPALAQITPDNTLGAESSTVNTRDETSDSIQGGAVRGQNLFHSFQDFNVSAGRGVYFANPDAVNNIFSRVTGDNASNILGILGVDGTANLYLVNPNGVVFGKGSSLDVQGSFTATTADAVEFSEGGLFSAVAPGESLLTINVPFGLQFGSTSGSIINRSKFPSSSYDNVGLQVPSGQNLTLVGGEVRFEGGEATAKGGNINIGGLSSTGRLGINDGDTLSFPKDVERADITFSNTADVDVRGMGGGNIDINARNLNIEAKEPDFSRIRAGVLSNSTFSEAQAGNITINADNNLTIDNSSILNELEEGAIGNAGNINLFAKVMDITNSGLVEASTYSKGDAGSINIFASDSVNVENGKGNTFIANNIYFDAQGNSQGINFIVGSLFVKNGAQIQSITAGTGNAGRIFIDANDTVSFDGRSANDFASIAVSDVSPGAIGNSGGIEVVASSLSLTNRAQFSSSTAGTGDAGNINITVKGNVELRNSSIFSEVTAPDKNIIQGDGGFGDGGDVIIKANSLLLENGSLILADTENIGNAGNIIIEVDENFILKGRGIGSSSNDQNIVPSQISTTAETNSMGNAGKISISANKLAIADSAGFISSSTFSTGNAADINISVEELSINNGGSLTSSTSNFGNAADINISTNNLFLTTGGVIAASTSGTANAGDIKLNVDGSLQVVNSFISTSSTQSSGGNIGIVANNIQLKGNSDFTTNISSGEGSGGNIKMTADSIIAFDDSDIFAFAQDGRGGNITLDTPVFFAENFTLTSLTADPDSLDSNSRADVNATGAVSGAVSIPDVSFIQNSLTELPNNSINTNELVANSCVVPSGERGQGNFIITGGESLPVRPGDDTRSTYSTGEVRNVPENNTSSWQPGDPIIEPEGAYRLANGQLVLSRECSQ